ncbi:PAS domain S-box protein [Mucilaginibacter jinjuensis]|uniref:PAS domain S-box protein n=1 Tax=Mucilaginibacter jinjuensis TaxID=1176721 RepID=A0ABY7THZ5_9SPHI|nr:PAS domain S-box protein [Mucilaginibacter jinjuensis]WCT14767.1 PAS domain S-box protein [Mucilaginibacter jinjuensis]
MPVPQSDKLLTATRFLDLTVDKESELKELADLATSLFSVPFAMIRIAGYDKQITNKKFPRKAHKQIVDDPLYQHLIRQDKNLIIENIDTGKFSKYQPFIIQKHKIKFYASVPLITHDGHYAGNILLMDHHPQKLTKGQKQVIKILVKRILHLIEFDYSLRVIKAQHHTAKETEIKLRSFFESSASCHLLIGKELEVIVFNRNMAEFIERHHHVTLYPGITVDKILHEAYLEDFIQDYEKALSGIPVKYEREVEYAEKTIWWYVTFEPGYNNAGEIVGISYNATDITERKHNEKKILEQNSSLSTIAHIQSHELRRPVASILGFMHLFKYVGYKATKHELVMMEKAVNELDDKIKEIVEISTRR